MSAHLCKELTDGCYRCDLNRDEIAANLEEDRADAQAAWLKFRRAVEANDPTRRTLKRDFIAGFLAGRDYS